MGFDCLRDLRSRSDAERCHLMLALVVVGTRKHDDYFGPGSARWKIRGTSELTKAPPDSPIGRRISKLPAFCRVAATLAPTPDSDIKIEVWLPVSGWNGKLLAVGNGGWAGSINYNGMTAALENGYATTSTDTGHTGGNASFVIGHPEKLIDFAYRAVHEMAVASKAIMTGYYKKIPRLSDWTGCSTGGRQGLMAAQRYPEDFDGIIAGAPANNQTHLCAWRIGVEAKILQDPAKVVPQAKLALVNRAVMSACDALDGVSDGLLTDPRRCRFDPSTLLCHGERRGTVPDRAASGGGEDGV